MVTPQPVPSEIIEQVAEYFNILSNPMRLQILNLLGDGEKCVQELVEETKTSQANVSKHLKIMLQAGIINRRPEGTSAYYYVEDSLIFELSHLVCNRLAEKIEKQALQFRNLTLANKI
ncbi:ArsR/SmtB family transcription factor [Geminocystis herdmanii]|uniref:ArsR/SmtB family transcription factor n=1 Tax=Geminocystis herdmanii TaxID=669359 RepID=UPI00034B88E2|nr:metalloregulator ArsR/SmtB family transcription factor [Geminocystis herdmanii]